MRSRGSLPDLAAIDLRSGAGVYRSKPFNSAISCPFNTKTRLQPLQSNAPPQPTRKSKSHRLRKPPTSKPAPPRRASWSGGAYAADPLLAAKPIQIPCLQDCALVAKRIHARGQVMRTFRALATEFKDGATPKFAHQASTNRQVRAITAELAELREHTVLLVEALQEYHQAQGIPYSVDGSNYAFELAGDLSWLDAMPVCGWLGMWGSGNPFLLSRIVGGKPLIPQPPNQPKAPQGGKVYEQKLQPDVMNKVKSALRYLRIQFREIAAGEVDPVETEQLDLAAVELQRFWRGKTARRRVVELQHAEAKLLEAQRWRESMVQYDAAVELQRYWRGSVVRGEAVQQRMRAEAAVELQRCWRGSIIRGRAPANSQSTVEQRCEEIAPVGVTGHRDRLIEFYTEYSPSMLDKVDAILNKYAGHEDVLFNKLEKKYGIETAATEEVNTAEPDAPSEETVNYELLIEQSLTGCRGDTDQQQMTSRADAALELQRCWRGKHARGAVLHQKQRNHAEAGAAVELQRCWRGKVVRGRAVQLKRRTQAAVEVQRCWRGSVVRSAAPIPLDEAPACKHLSEGELADAALVRAYHDFKAAATQEEAVTARGAVLTARYCVQQQQIAQLYKQFKVAGTPERAIALRELVLAARYRMQQQQRLQASIEAMRL